MTIQDLRDIMLKQYTEDDDGTINIVVESTVLGKKITMYCYDILIHADEQITFGCKISDIEFDND